MKYKSSFNAIVINISISFFLVLIVLITNSCVYYRTALEEEFRKQADTAYDEQKYQEALEYYQKTKIITLNNLARYRIAEIHIRLKEYDVARKEINKLLRRDKKNLLVKELDAYWYFTTGNLDEALKRYKIIEKETPFNGRVLSNLGVIYSKEDQPELAIKYFNKATQVKTLSLNVLREYIDVLLLIASDSSEENKEMINTNREIYLTGVLDRYLDAFAKSEVSIHFMFEIAKLLEKSYIPYSYPLYKAIAEASVDENVLKDVEIKNNANYIIARMILSKNYIPLDIDPVQTSLSMLERALNNGYGNIKEELNKLEELRIQYITTSVLKKRIAQLYYEKEILTRIEYETILNSFENDQQDEEKTTLSEDNITTPNP